MYYNWNLFHNLESTSYHNLLNVLFIEKSSLIFLKEKYPDHWENIVFLLKVIVEFLCKVDKMNFIMYLHFTIPTFLFLEMKITYLSLSLLWKH